MTMTIYIQSERPLTLEGLRQPWREILGPPRREDPADKEWVERLLAEAQIFREGMADTIWTREEEALRELAVSRSILNGGVYASPLVVPTGLPVRLLPLLEGMAVGSGCGHEAEMGLSPLALLWLKAMAVRFLPTVPAGVVRRVAAGEGIAILEIGHEGAVPRVREERRHEDEHMDEGMVLIQANLDDASPEWMAYAMERLLAAGANDVMFLPMTMKKSRPGVLLQVLCYQSDLEMMKRIVFTETTTFGLRYFPVAVHRLGRRFATVATRWGDVRVKLGFHRGERVQVSPEYEMCARLAKEAGVPLRTIYEEARRLAQDLDA
jgi:uncharacterized protein (DUF111 family)